MAQCAAEPRQLGQGLVHVGQVVERAGGQAQPLAGVVGDPGVAETIADRTF